MFRHPSYRDKLVDLLHKNPDTCKKLVKIVTDNEVYPFQEYASWYLSHLAKVHAKDIRMYYKYIVEVVLNSSNQTTVRNYLSCLNSIGIKSYEESRLYDRLLSFINDSTYSAGIQSYAILILRQFALNHPDLYPEIYETVYLNSDQKPPSYQISFKKIKTLFH